MGWTVCSNLNTLYSLLPLYTFESMFPSSWNVLPSTPSHLHLMDTSQSVPTPTPCHISPHSIGNLFYASSLRKHHAGSEPQGWMEVCWPHEGFQCWTGGAATARSVLFSNSHQQLGYQHPGDNWCESICSWQPWVWIWPQEHVFFELSFFFFFFGQSQISHLKTGILH